ncbi:hypothetical protein SLEP1_g3740 [Rubroshorea leprosula]|uniref:Uncharacterized protein n=1 Tax=Rubroshorea leprosula TaxID=152421 RepID=A0AAV5HS86_9ROSI|nr:hypothetical protein SLEP1_g3740 [Rubroshorea leprosula]
MSSSISFPRRLPSQPDLVLLAGRFWVCGNPLNSTFTHLIAKTIHVIAAPVLFNFCRNIEEIVALQVVFLV